MAYEIYSRDVIRVSTPVVTLNRRGRVLFNVAATKVLHEAGIENVFLMWDKDARKFAIRATNKKDTRAFTIRYASKNKWCAISAKGFLTHIGHQMDKTISYQASWDKENQMFEVATDKPQQQFSRAIKLSQKPVTVPPTQPSSASGNGHMTRKQAVVDFLRRHGPATKGEIVDGLQIPTGTVAFVLNQRETFVNREGRWHLVA